MATYNWAAPISGDWITATDWSPPTVPNDPTAVVSIDNSTLAAYEVTIAPGEFWTVGSLSMNAANDLAGSNSPVYKAAELAIDGTLNFGTGSTGELGGSLQTIVFLNNGTILNPGTLNAFIQGQGNVLLTGTNGIYITNWLQAQGGVVTVDTKSIAEMTGKTLFDGIFDAAGLGGVINLGGPRQNMIVNIATVEGPPAIPNGWTELILNGATTAIGEWNGTGYVLLESTLTTIAARGTVDILSGRNYTTTNTLSIQPSGLLNLRAGVVTTGLLDINGGTVQGSGDINSGVINNGTLRALDGLLTVGTGGLVGTGFVSFDYNQQDGSVSPTGATMQVFGVGSGQTFVMNGDDTLVISTPMSFAGTIDPKAGDKILLGGVVANSAVLQGTTLVLEQNGTPVDALHLGAGAAGETFAVSAFGVGSTQVKVAGAAATSVASATTGTIATSATSVKTESLSQTSSNNIAITQTSLNTSDGITQVFTSSGTGNSSINASGSTGSAILNGGSGSCFMTGGSGDDTFYIDARNPTTSTFSTVAGLHSADDITIWGVTLADFNVNLYDNAGAPGYTGLGYAFSEQGHPTVNVVLTGYSIADLTNGTLRQTLGTTSDGTPYLTVHVN